MAFTTNFDAGKGIDFNRNSITIMQDKLSRVIYFKKGGDLDIPDEVVAVSGNGATLGGHYDAVDLEGEVTIERGLFIYLLDLFENHNTSISTSAIVRVYSQSDQASYKFKYDNARIKKMPKLGVADNAGEITMTITFSLADRSKVETVGIHD